MTSAPADTRERLLDAAELAFAENGIQQASLRTITAAADANLAAVNYHFGSKDGLIREVLQRLVGPINAERLRRVDEAEAHYSDKIVPLDELLRHFLEPTLKLFATGQAHIPALIGRFHHETSPAVAQTMAAVLEPVVGRFLEALMRSVPSLTIERALIRGQFMVGALLETLSLNPDVLKLMQPDGVGSVGQLNMLDELVSFCAAGFRHE